MKPNRQVLQWLEGCSKEGISYWNTSLNNKSLTNLSPSVIISYTMSVNNFSFLHHLKKVSSIRNNSDPGIPVDSPFRSAYLRFKNVDVKDDQLHTRDPPTTSHILHSHPTKIQVGEDSYQSRIGKSWYTRPFQSTQNSKGRTVYPLTNYSEIESSAHGSPTDRHAEIYKRYIKNPRFLEMKEHREFAFIKKGQEVTMVMTLAGALIPAWALNASKKYRIRNTKTWIALCAAHLSIIGVNSIFNTRFRSYLTYIDEKYFSALNLDQIANP